jgi:hypothetical protein
MAQAVVTLETSLQCFGRLIDPVAETVVLGPELKKIRTRNDGAEVYKRYLASVRENIVQATMRIIRSVGEIIGIILDANLVIEEATNLSCNIGRQYRAIIDGTIKLNDALSKVQSTLFPEQTIPALEEMAKARTDLEMAVTNQFVDPMKAVLKEEVRPTALEILSRIIYGRQK